MNKKNNRKGFTTVELVIVIAVIAILATVLIPTFSNLITSATQTAALQDASSIYKSYCVQNATAFGGETVYVQVTDNDGNTKYYKGEKGQLNETAEPSTPEAGSIVIKTSKTTGVGFECVTGNDFLGHTNTKGNDSKCDRCDATLDNND